MFFGGLFFILGFLGCESTGLGKHDTRLLPVLDPPVKHCDAFIGYNRCYSCEEGYQIVNYPDGTQRCIACKSKVKNCMWCADDGKTCQRCDVGYRMIVKKNGKKQCKKCKGSAGKHCYTCSSDLKRCIDCNDEFYLTQKGRCKICPGAERASVRKQDAFDRQCNPTYDGDEVNGMTCNPGYRFLDNGVKQVCKPCKMKNCSTCTEDRKTCTYCLSGYKLSGDGGCEKCKDSKCFACDKNATTCLNCISGYWVTPDGTCQKCPKHCRICEDNSPTCQICSDGYGFSSNDGECKPCADRNCATCGEDYKKCDFCTSGYPASEAGCDAST